MRLSWLKSTDDGQQRPRRSYPLNEVIEGNTLRPMTSADIGFMIDASREEILREDLGLFVPVAESTKGSNRPFSQLLRIISVEPLPDTAAATCISIDVDGEENSFLLHGSVSPRSKHAPDRPAASSPATSFIFIDANSGAIELTDRISSLAFRYGRDDDVRHLNFRRVPVDRPTQAESQAEATINPFPDMSTDGLENLLSSMIGDKNDVQIGQMRTQAFVECVASVLTELRDHYNVTLTPNTIREYLHLGVGVPLRDGGTGYSDVSEISGEDWDAIRGKIGLIEIYLRSLNDEFSEDTRLKLQRFFEMLSEFSVVKALQGEKQSAKTLDQYRFLSMQLIGPLNTLTDTFGHIYRAPRSDHDSLRFVSLAPRSDIEMNDIVRNRRILTASVPTLLKYPRENFDCTIMLLALIKAMMADLLDADGAGGMPLILVLDPRLYHSVASANSIIACGRSLGVSIAFRSIKDSVLELSAIAHSAQAKGPEIASLQPAR